MQSIQVKSGTVKYPAGKVFDSQWGERQNILVALNDGTEEHIWFKAGQTPHATLQKGQAIQVLYEERNGKTQRRIIVSDETRETASEPNIVPVTTTTPLGAELTPDQKRAIAAYIREQAELLGFCLKVSREKFANKNNPLVETEESIRTLATSLYITVQRKFQI
jgi:hypothetical protein